MSSQVAVWLTVIHTAGSYHNFLAEFDRAPPFQLRRLSKVLPLSVRTSIVNHSKVGVAFASGLALLPDRAGLVITYGCSDMEARAFVLNQRGIEAAFTETLSLSGAS